MIPRFSVVSQLLLLLCFKKMADSDNSVTGSSSVDSRENSNQEVVILEFSEDEETLIARMYRLVGDRWSLIAGRIPGRTAEEIEKYCTARYSPSQRSGRAMMC